MSTTTTERTTIPQPETSEPRNYGTATAQEHNVGALEIVAWDSPRVSAAVHVGTYGGTTEARMVNKDRTDREPFVTITSSVKPAGIAATEVKTFLTVSQAWDLLDSLTASLRPTV